MRVENSKIPRCNIVFLNKKKYLVDLSTHLKACIFPAGTWYFKNNAMEISDEECQKLRLFNGENTNSSGRNISGIFLGGSLYGFIKAFEGDSIDHISIIKLIVILFITYFFVFLIRLFTSEGDHEHLEKLLKKEKIEFDYVIFIKKDSSPEHGKKCILKTMGQIVISILLMIWYLYLKTAAIILIILILEALRLSKRSGVLKPDIKSIIVCERKKYL